MTDTSETEFERSKAFQASTCDALKGKQKLFVEEYLVDLNATQAAIRAGYSERTARQIGSENLAKSNVKAAIDAALLERSKQTQIDADRVIAEITAIAFANIADFIKVGEDGLPHIDMTNANRDQTAGVALIDVRLKDMGDGTNKVMRFRITIGNKLRALEYLARHLGIEGFRGDAPRPQEKRHVNESPVKNDPKREEALRLMEEQVREKRRRQAKYASNKQN